MTDKELKKLKDDLWHSADILRAAPTWLPINTDSLSLV